LQQTKKHERIDSQMLEPKVGISLVAKPVDDDADTIYINICHSDARQLEEAKLVIDEHDNTKCSHSHKPMEMVWSVPHVLGPVRVHLDKATDRLHDVYDIVFATATFRKAMADEKQLDLIVQSARRGVDEHRKSRSLCPLRAQLARNCESNFVGAAQENEQISEKEQISSSAAHRQVVEPAFSMQVLSSVDLDRRRQRSLSVCVQLPQMTRDAFAERTRLNVGASRLQLSTDDPTYRLDVELPATIDHDASSAQFDWDTLALVVRMPIVATADEHRLATMDTTVQRTPEHRRVEAIQEPIVASSSSQKDEVVAYRRNGNWSLVFDVANVDARTVALVDDGSGNCNVSFASARDGTRYRCTVPQWPVAGVAQMVHASRENLVVLRTSSTAK
jgi:PIH1 N-terminal domain/PIH1 CS-like domain